MIQEDFGIPYYAVIFTSTLTGEKMELYNQLNEQLSEEIQKIPGYLGHDSARSEIGVTAAYFKNKDAIELWRHHHRHTEAKKIGITDFYSSYHIRICKVEHEHGFKR